MKKLHIFLLLVLPSIICTFNPGKFDIFGKYCKMKVFDLTWHIDLSDNGILGLVKVKGFELFHEKYK